MSVLQLAPRICDTLFNAVTSNRTFSYLSKQPTVVFYLLFFVETVKRSLRVKACLSNLKSNLNSKIRNSEYLYIFNRR